MGNGQLVSLCENMAKIMQKRKMVFIADRDHNETNKKLGGKDGSEFKKWGNNVYSFILPIPDFRTTTPEICIEHLYSDEMIKTEIENSNVKRRLYMLAIEKYIDYYTNKRVQRNLGVLTPMEFHERKLENVA